MIRRFWAALTGKTPNPEAELQALVTDLGQKSEAIQAAIKHSGVVLAKLGARGVALLPQVIDLLSIAQALYPVTGSGALRLGLVKRVLEGLYAVLGTQGHKFSADWPLWLPVINVLVAELKNRGRLVSKAA